ncbi:hypothetical protein [Phytohabitans houttuyneae]|uniref:ATP-grasp domain-containing protein n=1 Tax=Phytohabitans houttuyneae TaxID=1076126 RepID=A0A6V8KCA0_9ACTN|nr:hypothetical protein [Phytohabitans houttuyneae]GFJ78375.1 hypothetical protein Phou_025550 [Phytohabitans houttuyneae]
MAVKVLAGFAESLAAIESAWCLRDAGYEVVAFTRAGKRPPLAAARGVRVHPVPAPETDVAACVEAIRALVDAERPTAVLPLDDAALLACDRAAEAGGRILGVPVAGATGAAARLALDKSEQIALAEKAGIPVPPTGSTEPPAGPGPWMVKSALAAVEVGGRLTRPAGAIAREPGEVPAIVAKLGGPALVQPVLDGIGEGVFGIAVDGEAYALSAHRRVRMMNPRGSGSSACRSIPVDLDLAGPVRRFVAEAGWHGIFMVELLRDADGQPWFMELNGRTWGSMALARHRGLPYPVWAVQAALDPAWRPPAVPEAPHLLCRHAGRELVHLLAVMRGAKGADAGRWPSRGATLKAMLRRERGNRWYHADERGVFLRDTWHTVADQLRRR